MKLVGHVESFLTDTVNLNQTRLNQLSNRVDAIVDYLKTDAVLAPLYQGHIPQGSWAHRTIIRPLPGDEFDADFLLHLSERQDWSAEPAEYLRQLRAALKRSSIYKDMIRKKNRCVRIAYANECHVDVVPYLIRPNGRQVIVNYAANAFEDTNPEGFTEWMRERDALARGNLRKVIRLMKYLRDFKNTFSCPSIILTTLLGERVQAFDEEARYGDVPTALLTLLADLSAMLQRYPAMPVIADPSCPGTTFNHRWDEEKYANFRTWVSFYSARVAEAYHEPDRAKSLARWQQVFGPDFKDPVKAAPAAMTKAASAPADQRAPLEQFIEEKGFTRVGGYRAQVECTVLRKDGFRHGQLRALGKVGKQRRLRFQLTTDVPSPFGVYWKVRNRGSEASSVGQLRGELIPDDGSRTHEESTLYVGRHYVEVYVVKDGRVLASDHHEVVIE